MRRTFAIDALECPKCHGRMQPIAVRREREGIVRYLAAIGEDTEKPPRSRNADRPIESQVLRRQALGRPPSAGQHPEHDDPA